MTPIPYLGLRKKLSRRLKIFSGHSIMGITVDGIPLESLLKAYERDKRYREAHQEQIKKKNREYYLKMKDSVKTFKT